jgi:hypothetical protein
MHVVETEVAGLEQLQPAPALGLSAQTSWAGPEPDLLVGHVPVLTVDAGKAVYRAR